MAGKKAIGRKRFMKILPLMIAIFLAAVALLINFSGENVSLSPAEDFQGEVQSNVLTLFLGVLISLIIFVLFFLTIYFYLLGSKEY